MKKHRTMLRTLLLMMVLLCLPLLAHAATWYTEDGLISIEMKGTTQTVSQAGVVREDVEPIISSRDPDTAQDCIITVVNSARFTLQDAAIRNTYGSAIVVKDGLAAITIKGENLLEPAVCKPGILVNAGSVTLTGDGELTINSVDAAAIGSENRKAMSGGIAIRDQVKVTANAAYVFNTGRDIHPAAIGSGYMGDMSGVIRVEGNADVTAVAGAQVLEEYEGSTVVSDNAGSGAGIGSGEGGDMSGDIFIGGRAKVNARSLDDGAGIGSGEMWQNLDENGAVIASRGGMTGKIVITDGADVYAYGYDLGAGIGSGDNVDMAGSILISGYANVEAMNDDDGAAIGSGEDGHMSGAIHITGHAVVSAEADDRGAAIGSGEDGDMAGTILIDGHTQVMADTDDDSAGIGAGETGKVTSEGRIFIGGQADVQAYGNGEGAGIGSGMDASMEGLIVIFGNAKVMSDGGSEASAIGCDESEPMTGTIAILDKAVVEAWRTLDEERSSIGRGYGAMHDDDAGEYYVGGGVKINGVRGTNTEELLDVIGCHLDSQNRPTNLFSEKKFRMPELPVIDPFVAAVTEPLFPRLSSLPATGDSSRPILWLSLCAASLSCILWLERRRVHG